MIITICGSTRYYQQMQEVGRELQARGHEVLLPHLEFGDFHEVRCVRREQWRELKRRFMKDHFEKMKRSHAILVLNYDKGDMKNYIGGNTLLDIAVAFEHGKQIFLLNPAPADPLYSDEIEGMDPVILNANLDALKDNVEHPTK